MTAPVYVGTVTLPAAAYERLRTAGTLLANVALYASQRVTNSVQTRQSLDECRKEWDAALEAVRSHEGST